MRNFTLKYSDTKLHFGMGVVGVIKKYLEGFEYLTIVTGKSSAIKSQALNDIKNILKEMDIEYSIFDKIKPNPIVEIADALADFITDRSSDCIMAIGGGSVIDTAKVSSIIALSGGSAGEYLRGREVNDYLPSSLSISHMEQGVR